MFNLLGKLVTPLGIGFIGGVYAAQNYNIPNITTYIDKGAEYLKKTEHDLRKENPDNDNEKKK